MLADFGYGVLFITLLMAIYSIIAAMLGHFLKSPKWVESARLAMLLTFPGVTLSTLSLVTLLLTDQYSVSFVYEVTSRSMPLYLKVTALWGGQAGSILLWSWLMSTFAAAVTLRKWDRDRELLPWVIVVCSATLAFFIGLTIFSENPFAKYWQLASSEVIKATLQPAGAILFTPKDGNGLNPLLRHPGMIIHPPMLYLGFVSFVIPFAFAIASLVTGRADDRWIRITRRWTLIAWVFLSAGLVLGSRWAYDVLGWGGYWAWDPVEVAAFMPWLVGTAFLHSVMIQEKRGMLKHWSMLLIILTYCQVIYGTFLTRTGLVASVHAFAKSDIGPAFLIFVGASFVISIGLLIYRWATLSSEAQITSILSREALFLLNNFLFVIIDLVCLYGVHAPLIQELLTGEMITMGPEWYDRITGPLFALLLLLMGIAPLSAWGHSTAKTLGSALWKPLVGAALAMVALFALGIRNPFALAGFFVVTVSGALILYEFWRAARARSRAQKENLLLALWRLFGRNRRRYGGYVIHLSVVLMAIGIIGIGMFQTQTQRGIGINDTIELDGYTVRYDSLAQFTHTDGRFVTRAVVSVFKDGKFISELYPRVDTYESGETMTIPSIESTLSNDLYIVLANWEGASPELAPFRVYHNPLINWLWIGSILLIIGSCIAAWPDKDPEVVPVRERRQQAVAYQGGD
jgi:cytochrome c-type biogenesis protein CcmF